MMSVTAAPCRTIRSETLLSIYAADRDGNGSTMIQGPGRIHRELAVSPSRADRSGSVERRFCPRVAVAILSATACGRVGYASIDDIGLAEMSASVGAGSNAQVIGAGGNGSTASGGAGGAIAGVGGSTGGGTSDAAMQDAGAADATAVDSVVSDSAAPCSGGVALGGPTLGPLHGSVMPVWMDTCPDGEAIIGYVGSTGGKFVETLQTSCGRLSFIQAGSSCRVSVSPGTVMPLRGNPNGSSPWVLACPTDQVMVVAEGQSGGRIDQLGIECAPLVVSSSGGVLQLSIGSLTVIAPEGGPSGTAFRDPCPPNQIATGTNSSYNAWIQAYQVVCSTPTLLP